VFYGFSTIGRGLTNFGFSILNMVVGVVLPFFVMYYFRNDVFQESKLKHSILFSFFGCWAGQFFSYFLNLLVQYLRSGGFIIGGWYWFAIIWHIWYIISLAVSRIFFVIFAAILFGYYVNVMTGNSNTSNYAVSAT
jgi:hypothetical protein